MWPFKKENVVSSIPMKGKPSQVVEEVVKEAVKILNKEFSNVAKFQLAAMKYKQDDCTGYVVCEGNNRNRVLKFENELSYEYITILVYSRTGQGLYLDIMGSKIGSKIPYGDVPLGHYEINMQKYKFTDEELKNAKKEMLNKIIELTRHILKDLKTTR